MMVKIFVTVLGDRYNCLGLVEELVLFCSRGCSFLDMGDKEEEVSAAVDNGVVPMENKGDSVVDNMDHPKDGFKDMEEDNKDEGKVETQMDIDKEGTKELEQTGELKKDHVRQENGELQKEDAKEDQEPMSKAVEQENGENSEDGNKGKVESAPGFSVDNESADKDNQSAAKDAGKIVSKRKRGKDKPKLDEEKTKNKKTVEKKKEEPKTPIAPASDRPVRERKSVERLVATIEKDSGKEFHIEKVLQFKLLFFELVILRLTY